MSIICPEGVGTGELVEVTAPSGALLQATVISATVQPS